MSISFNKTGVIKASGKVNPNIVLGTYKNIYTTTTAASTERTQCIMSVGSGGNGTFSITQEAGLPVGIYSYNITNNTSGNRDFQQGGIPYVAGQKYTGSFWAKGSGTILYRSWNRTKGSQVFQQTWTLTSDWKYYTHTFTATQAQQDNDCTFHLGVTGASSIKLCGMKLELGETATPWCPAEDDEIYVGDTHGFIEAGNMMSMYQQGFIQTTEFIEY